MRHLVLVALMGTSSLVLSACGDGNPFYPVDSDGDGIPDHLDDHWDGPEEEDPDEGEEDPDDGEDLPDDDDITGNDVLDTGVVRPPAGSGPTLPDGSLRRLEALDDAGGGMVASVSYNAADDTITVDGLGFDGGNVYGRGTPVSQLTHANGASNTPGAPDNVYAVYMAEVEITDPISNRPITQIIPYTAIVGMSENGTSATDNTPRTSFALVRTGGYNGLGFGGFVYGRNGGVTLPEGPFTAPNSGQAIFVGDYAGVRVFAESNNIEYTTGELEIRVDFRDFNSNQAVGGTLSDRRAFDETGAEIALGTDLSSGELVLPDVKLTIVAGSPSITPQGEIGGSLSSFATNDGDRVDYETGSYYGMIAGDLTNRADGGEIVGIMVLDSQDPRLNDLVRETGGFIVYR